MRLLIFSLFGIVLIIAGFVLAANNLNPLGTIAVTLGGFIVLLALPSSLTLL